MDLVKAFHPDREPDAEEKIRKTALMEWEFEKSLKKIKKAIKRMKQDVEMLRDPVVLKGWLRSYRTEKEDWL